MAYTVIYFLILISASGACFFFVKVLYYTAFVFEKNRDGFVLRRCCGSNPGQDRSFNDSRSLTL
jgi:hypothetical protein